MPVCFGCLEHAGVTTLDCRWARDDLDRPIQRRVTDCPRCGTRAQTLVDDGPTPRRYVGKPSKFSDSLRTMTVVVERTNLS